MDLVVFEKMSAFCVIVNPPNFQLQQLNFTFIVEHKILVISFHE